MRATIMLQLCYNYYNGRYLVMTNNKRLLSMQEYEIPLDEWESSSWPWGSKSGHIGKKNVERQNIMCMYGYALFCSDILLACLFVHGKIHSPRDPYCGKSQTVFSGLCLYSTLAFAQWIKDPEEWINSLTQRSGGGCNNSDARLLYSIHLVLRRMISSFLREKRVVLGAVVSWVSFLAILNLVVAA
jgi:hypothetical protein